MKTTKLDQQYPKLTARERLQLVTAAFARGDHEEVRRLNESAPRIRLSVPHHYGLVVSLERIAVLYLIEQLERATEFWFLRFVGLYVKDDEALEGMRLAAYSFRLHAEAWRKMCDQLGLAPDTLPLVVAKIDDILKLTQRLAEELAFTSEEVAAIATRQFGENTAVLTVESAAQSLRRSFESLARDWEPRKTTSGR